MADYLDIEWTHLARVLEDFAIYFIQVARENLGRNRSYATGNLGDTMTYSITIEEDRFSVKIELEDYWQYVEKGRRPGKMPPVSAIRDWIMVKPIQPQPYTYTPSVKSLAFLIQRSIKQKKGYAPPRIVLEGWIDKKGIQPRPQTITPSVESLAFLIARKIGREGTQPAPFFEPAREDAIRRFETPIADAIREDIETYLQKQLDDFAKLFE